MSQIVQTPAQQKWLSKLLGYDFEIFYTPGRSNVVFDALPLHPAHSHVIYQAMSACRPLLLDQLREFYSSHAAGQALIAKQQEGKLSDHLFSVAQDILHYKGRIFVPQESNLRAAIIEEFHNSPLGGHSGVKGTLARIAASFAWPHMRRDIQLAVQNCRVCQTSKYSTQKPLGLLNPLPIPTQAWEDLSMDFITHLPQSHGKTTIWVIVDRLTKYAHFVALPNRFTTSTLAPIFLVEVYRLHGMPKTIVSDPESL